MSLGLLGIEVEFDEWLRAELQKKGLTEEQFSQLIMCQLRGKERYTQLMVEAIHRFSSEAVTTHADVLDALARMSDEEIRAFIARQDRPDLFAVAYHYYLARDVYQSMFANVHRVASKPEYFLTALLDIFELDFNTQLFVYTKPLGACKGLIFELDGGVAPDRKMGIVLTPLAFASATTLFQTLFHELSHRLHFAREGSFPGRIESELYAYLHDKLLLRSFLADVDLSWLAPALTTDLFGLARQFEEREPTFLADTAARFAQDIDRIKPQLMERHKDSARGLSPGRLKRFCESTRRVAEVPKTYSVITDFLWLYSTRLSALSRLGTGVELATTHTTCLLLLILFSREYERRYHPQEGNLSYGRVTILHADGGWDEGEEHALQEYCRFQQQVYQEGGRHEHHPVAVRARDGR